MKTKSITELLREEKGTIRKSWAGRISVALVYPNTYHVGMSNLGFQTVYEQLNQIEHVVCERAFMLPKDKTAYQVIRTIESRQHLTDFDVVAFSISFENDFPNILYILDSAKIPRLSEDRDPSKYPLVVGGGVACFLNPEPLAPFFDVFLLGEAECLLEPFFNRFDPGSDRLENLVEISNEIPGVYVPLFYTVRYHSEGTVSKFEPDEDVPEKIRRVFLEDISRCSTCSRILTPNTVFNDTYLVEVSRGCPHGCRFCSAGFVYRPPRFRPLSLLTEAMASGISRSHHIGLMGAAVSDLPCISELCSLADKKGIRVSFSSLRADAMEPELIAALKKSGAKTATIAPDAGSERLRNVINKGITQDHILAAAENLVSAGILNLKLYFMVGLPTEAVTDVEDIVQLCKKIKHRFLKSSRGRGRIGNITVSLNSFVPKAATPFQWASMDNIHELKKKIKIVKNGLKGVANIRVHSDIPRWAYIQGLLSRGDRKVAGLLMKAVDNRGNWPKTFKESPINADFYVLRKRQRNEIFPWDFIDHSVKKSFLMEEYQRALQEKSSPACSLDTNCIRCGACDSNRAHMQGANTKKKAKSEKR